MMITILLVVRVLRRDTLVLKKMVCFPRWWLGLVRFILLIPLALRFGCGLVDSIRRLLILVLRVLGMIRMSSFLLIFSSGRKFLLRTLLFRVGRTILIRMTLLGRRVWRRVRRTFLRIIVALIMTLSLGGRVMIVLIILMVVVRFGSLVRCLRFRALVSVSRLIVVVVLLVFIAGVGLGRVIIIFCGVSRRLILRRRSLLRRVVLLIVALTRVALARILFLTRCLVGLSLDRLFSLRVIMLMSRVGSRNPIVPLTPRLLLVTRRTRGTFLRFILIASLRRLCPRTYSILGSRSPIISLILMFGRRMISRPPVRVRRLYLLIFRMFTVGWLTRSRGRRRRARVVLLIMTRKPPLLGGITRFVNPMRRRLLLAWIILHWRYSLLLILFSRMTWFLFLGVLCLMVSSCFIGRTLMMVRLLTTIGLNIGVLLDNNVKIFGGTLGRPPAP